MLELNMLVRRYFLVILISAGTITACSNPQNLSMATVAVQQESEFTSDESNQITNEEVLHDGNTLREEGELLPDKGIVTKRFGLIVEESIEERSVPLDEEDFKGLKKGQYFYSETAKAFGAEYTVGIIDVVGMYDGEIMIGPRGLGTGMAQSRPYYQIEEDSYVVLFFEGENVRYKLDHIEVWDAEGNKLRVIEIY